MVKSIATLLIEDLKRGKVYSMDWTEKIREFKALRMCDVHLTEEILDILIARMAEMSTS
jgi:hypothetical protein